MPFLVNDIYTSSGSDFIFNSWTTPVTKFDTSSFYNWEQDNEPIHDLEERTYLNWEHAGFHTSSVPGMVFTVSADTPAATLAASSNIFTTVSAAVEAIPSDLRFPLLIEVANFDAMGELNLKDIKIGYGGSLEIINRNFVKAYAASSEAAGAFANKSCLIEELDSEAEYTKYQLINEVSSVDISGTWNDASAMNIKTKVLNSGGDPRAKGKINSVFQPFANAIGALAMTEQETSRLAVSITGDWGDAANKWSLPLFERTAAAKESPHFVGSHDVSAKDLLDVNECELIPGKGVAKNGPAQGMLYGNYLTRLRVNNCNGPIYIRNFFVNSSDHAGDGVQVFNSNDIWLEDCASINNKVGFNFRNSKVYINRGIVAYRNYGVNSSEKRKTGNWNEVLWAPASRFVDDGAGLRAHNSEIILNNASSVVGRQSLDNEPYAAFGVHAHQAEFMINFSRNSFGVVLDNSILHGGMASGTATSYASGLHFNVELSNEYGIHARNSTIDLDGRLKVYSNARGMLLENSKAYLNEWAFRGNQHEGIHALNSDIQYNKNITSVAKGTSPNDLEYQFDCSGNGIHLVLDAGSTMMPTLTSAMPAYYGQMRFVDHHGLNVTTSGEGISLPVSPVQVKNNSNAVLVHPIVQSLSQSNTINLAGVTLSGSPIYGECIAIRNNSKVTTKGSKNGATVIYGGDTGTDNGEHNLRMYNAHKNCAGVYVEDNSSFECNGPTVMFNFGVDVLADSNSVMNFRPQRIYDTGELDASGWDLGNHRNHTAVELHSTNSCLVARNNSTINMRDLGDYNACWGSTNRSSPDYSTGDMNSTASGLDTSAYTFAGSMQFYPNPIGSEFYINRSSDLNEPTGRIENPRADYVFLDIGPLMSKASTSEQSFKRNYYLDDALYTEDHMFQQAHTAGGTCLRALGGSQVDVLNVNFPTGWWNPSGIIYDVSGAEKGSGPANLCNRTFIWNIADNSKLHAAFCSVSGNDPRDMGYHGPSSVYFVPGGTTAELGSIATARAPSGTPHTSSLSVLDFFGQGRNDILPVPQFSGSYIGSTATSLEAAFLPLQLSAPLKLINYGTTGTSLENRGPFRLYVSVDSIANTFSSIDATGGIDSDDGYARQLYAQGYNLSGPVSAGPTTLSATYGHAIRFPTATEGHGNLLGSDLSLSGFVYNNEVVDPTTYTRIQLDESAAHIFANAKNGAMGTSNRAKICSIYVSRGSVNGEAAALSSQKTFGRGYTSPNIFGLGRKE